MRLEHILASCNKCGRLNKPFVDFKVYRNWLPKRVITLAVGESPPPGKKESFFYNLFRFDRMRLSIKFILGLETDVEVLSKLKSCSTFVTAAIKCRPRSRYKLATMSEKCRYILKREIESLKPERIIAMGKLASLSISRIFGLNPPSNLKAIKEIELPAFSLVFMPHPNHIFRFRRGEARRFRKLLVDKELKK